MHIVHINNITVSFAGRAIYRDLSWVVGDRDRVGLVGPNGAGKSTLFRVVMGEIEPDAGHVSSKPDIRIGYLRQDVELPQGESLIDTAMIKPPALARVEAQLDTIEKRLAEPAVYGDELELSRVLEQHSALLGDFESMNGHRHGSHVRELLSMLGFDSADYGRATETLSGGRRSWWRWYNWRWRRPISCYSMNRITILMWSEKASWSALSCIIPAAW